MIMESDLDKVKTLDSDIWNMTFTHEGETLSFTGKTPKTISELLLGVKQYMESKKKKDE